MRTGSPIVYTSADSVFQIAAHEKVIPLDELYRISEIAREMLQGSNRVGRVIARPFEGESGRFTRTANRHDFAVPPPAGMLLDKLAESGVRVHAIGKISDIFLGRGISFSVKTKSNDDGMEKTGEALREQKDGLIFVNLVDFDQQFGHRNDMKGYAGALEALDRWLPSLDLADRDMLILTADHGCDPTTPSTDHSREYAPLLVFGSGVKAVREFRHPPNTCRHWPDRGTKLRHGDKSWFQFSRRYSGRIVDKSSNETAYYGGELEDVQDSSGDSAIPRRVQATCRWRERLRSGYFPAFFEYSRSAWLRWRARRYA